MIYFYLAKKTGGTLGTGQGPEFSEYKDKGWGTHEPISLPREKIKEIELLPEEVKELVLKHVDM